MSEKINKFMTEIRSWYQILYDGEEDLSRISKKELREMWDECDGDVDKFIEDVGEYYKIAKDELNELWDELGKKESSTEHPDMGKPRLSDYEYDKYVCNTPADVRLCLNKYGVAIFPNVLDPEECEVMKSDMWDYLEHISSRFHTPIRRDNPETWKEYKKFYPSHSMILQQYSIGQSQFIWNLRQKPQIIDLFSHLWETPREDLITSFDGASFHFPPETTGSGWFRGRTWLHSDQSWTRPGYECVQSWVTAYDVNPGDATLAFLEGSHRFHGEFRDHFEIEKHDDWCPLKTPEHHEFYQKRGCLLKYIKCPAGSLVFWDSRTIHSGQEALKNRLVPNHRCVAYICMTPRSLATPAVLKKRIKHFEEMRTTNHYPYKPKLFPKNPHTFGKDLPNFETIHPPVISGIGRRLVGYNS